MIETIEKHDHILILDFGSQVTQLIARRAGERYKRRQRWVQSPAVSSVLCHF